MEHLYTYALHLQVKAARLYVALQSFCNARLCAFLSYHRLDSVCLVVQIFCSLSVEPHAFQPYGKLPTAGHWILDAKLWKQQGCRRPLIVLACANAAIQQLSRSSEGKWTVQVPQHASGNGHVAMLMSMHS